MPSLDITFYMIIAITLISFVMAISAWVYLTSLISKISLLEREIEKRSIEFDAFKKELITNRHTTTAASVIESSEPITTTPESALSNEDTIQIFRNVRGTFENSEPVTASPVQSYQEPEPERTVVQTDAGKPSSADPTPTTLFTFSKGTITTAAPQQHGYESSNVPLREPSIFAVPLHSEITKDADFQTLWKNITVILQNNISPNICIDFSNIHFLYDKEMAYLEKINYLITNQRGHLSLVNCGDELLTLINRNQQLRTLVL